MKNPQNLQGLLTKESLSKFSREQTQRWLRPVAFPPSQQDSNSQPTWFSRVPALSAAPAKRTGQSEGMLCLLAFLFI